ncbi:unnamed protein product [Hapterophycus canaliculatus]
MGRRLKRAGVEWKGRRRNEHQDIASLFGGVSQQAVGGGVAFVAVLAFSQALQGFALRVSCSTPLGLPTALGFTTVAVASATSIRVAEGMSSGLQASSRRGSQDGSDSWRSLRHVAERPVTSGEIGAGSFGLVLYRALGGRFSSVAPSALHMPGAFSK